MPSKIDITGMSFGRLTAIREVKQRKRWNRRWLFRCSCGKEIEADQSWVISGNTRSCGCLHRQMLLDPQCHYRKHGQSRTTSRNFKGTSAYISWCSMNARCRNPKDPNWKNYGGRGITICPQWSDFSVFLKDMGPRPRGTTIDRIDVNGNYEPGNCEWNVPIVQGSHIRANVYIEWKGRKICLAELRRITGTRLTQGKLRYWMKKKGVDFMLSLLDSEKAA